MKSLRILDYLQNNANHIEESNMRFYVFSTILYAIALVIHFFFLFFFAYIEITVMFIFNIFSCLIFSICLYLNRIGRLKIAYQLAVIEVTLHAAIATISIGWQSNFSLYTIALCMAAMFTTFLKTRTRMIQVIVITCIQCIAFVYVVFESPLYTQQATIINFIGVTNFVSTIVIVCLLSYSFHRLSDKLNEQLKGLINIDPLTGVYNRRYFNEYIQQHSFPNKKKKPSSAQNAFMNFGFAIVDIDNFKQINDVHGHLVGDEVIKQTLEIIKGTIQDNTSVCRFGGEEFVIIFKDTTKSKTLETVEKIRHLIENYYFQMNGKTDLTVTVSIGVAGFLETCDGDLHKLLQVADERLYEAKATGKNRVVHA